MSEILELSIDPVSRLELSEFKLLADTQFFEQMGSESFNRKLTGIVSAGIYRGFDYEISGTDTITLCTGEKNTVAVERDGQLITVQGQHPITVKIPRAIAVAVVIEAISQHGLLTSQIDKNSDVPAAAIRVVPLGLVADHHVIALTVHLPDMAALNETHISIEQRQVGGVKNTPTFEQTKALIADKSGVAGGFATLDASLQIPTNQLPVAIYLADASAFLKNGTAIIKNAHQNMQLNEKIRLIQG